MTTDPQRYDITIGAVLSRGANTDAEILVTSGQSTAKRSEATTASVPEITARPREDPSRTWSTTRRRALTHTGAELSRAQPITRRWIGLHVSTEPSRPRSVVQRETLAPVSTENPRVKPREQSVPVPQLRDRQPRIMTTERREFTARPSTSSPGAQSFAAKPAPTTQLLTIQSPAGKVREKQHGRPQYTDVTTTTPASYGPSVILRFHTTLQPTDTTLSGSRTSRTPQTEPATPHAERQSTVQDRPDVQAPYRFSNHSVGVGTTLPSLVSSGDDSGAPTVETEVSQKAPSTSPTGNAASPIGVERGTLNTSPPAVLSVSRATTTGNPPWGGFDYYKKLRDLLALEGQYTVRKTSSFNFNEGGGFENPFKQYSLMAILGGVILTVLTLATYRTCRKNTRYSRGIARRNKRRCITLIATPRKPDPSGKDN